MMFNFNFFSGSFDPFSTSTHPKYTRTAYPPALSQYLPTQHSAKRTHDEMAGVYWAPAEDPRRPSRSFSDYLSAYAQKIRVKKQHQVKLNHEGLRNRDGGASRRQRKNSTIGGGYAYDYGYDQQFTYQPPYQPTPTPAPAAEQYYPDSQHGYYGVRTRHKIARQKERSRYQSGYQSYPPPSTYYMGTNDYPVISNLGAQKSGPVPIVPAHIVDLGYEDHGRRKLRRVGRLHRDDYH